MTDHVEKVDARGLSCPQPVMLASQAINRMGKGVVEVLADSGTARDNVLRLAQNHGWKVSIEEPDEGNFRLILKK